MEKKEIKEMVNMTGEIKGVSFVSAMYTSKETGEVANFVLNVGIPHHKVLSRDLNVLRALRNDPIFVIELTTKYDEKTVKATFDELEKGLVTSLDGTNARSVAMTTAFVQINKGVKLNLENLDLYLYGYKVSKKVVKAGTYKEVKSRPLTLCKNEVKRHFKSTNYRTLKFDGTETFTTGGKRLVIG